MSKLDIYVRPLVIFDARNKVHRQYYSKFLETGSWKECPYRWAIPDDVGNLQGMIQRKLLDFYMAKEFKPKVVDILAKRSYNKTSPKKRTKAI